MDKPKFTPGPWEINAEELDIVSGEKTICTCYFVSELSEDDEGLHNANLIAAAPDMYKALESSKNVIGYLLLAFGSEISENKAISKITVEQLLRIKQALAKAEGGTDNAN